MSAVTYRLNLDSFSHWHFLQILKMRFVDIKKRYMYRYAHRFNNIGTGELYLDIRNNEM